MFQNEHIRLRKVEPQDLPFLYVVENDDSQWQDASTHNPLSQKDLRDYIESSTGDIFRDGQLRLIVEMRDAECGMRTLGVADLFDFDPLAGKAALGLYILPEARGKHIAEQVVRMLEEYAFEFLHLRQLYAIISAENTPCVRLFERLGYHASARLLCWDGKHDAIVFQHLAPLLSPLRSDDLKVPSPPQGGNL